MPTDWKQAPRVIDPTVTQRVVARYPWCLACSVSTGRLTGDHVLRRSQGGDDVAGNIITLCGDGAKGCHGARHGSPYSVRRQPVPAFPIEWERRDAEWVARRIGERLAEYRPDVIVYLVDKLDETAAFDFLRRNYPPDPEFPWKPEKLS